MHVGPSARLIERDNSRSGCGSRNPLHHTYTHWVVTTSPQTLYHTTCVNTLHHFWFSLLNHRNRYDTPPLAPQLPPKIPGTPLWCQGDVWCHVQYELTTA